jgi:hypothetical protein
MGNPMPPKIKRFPASKQRRLDQLLDKLADGIINDKEKATLERLVAEAEALMVSNSERLANFARSQSPQPPPGAIPVTVWVSPQLIP